jgi:GntR family transcriptional regulator, transcriptional repressor for pyruvate dehydrogenase complex
MIYTGLMVQYSSNKKLVAQVRVGEQVALFLQERIQLGEFLPGHRLPSERELAAELGVSRTALREGLRLLEYQKYVEIRRGNHGGAMVLPTTFEVALERIQGQVTDLVDLLEYRLLVEPRAAELAAARIRDHELDHVRALHHRQMTDPGLSRPEARAIDAEMHEVIASASGNRHLAHAVRSIRARLTVGLDLTGHTLTRARKSRTEHARIIEALEQHDAPAARTFMKRHLAATSESILVVLREHGIDIGSTGIEHAADYHDRGTWETGKPTRLQAVNGTD